VALTPGREGNEVAGGMTVTEITVLLGDELELELDVASNDEAVDVDTGGLADNTATGDDGIEAVVVTEGVSETVD
jgi:hypothetical protein